MSASPRRLGRAAAVLAVLALTGTALSACNTVAGAGQDVSSVGRDLTGGATAVQSGVARSTGAATR